MCFYAPSYKDPNPHTYQRPNHRNYRASRATRWERPGGRFAWLVRWRIGRAIARESKSIGFHRAVSPKSVARPRLRLEKRHWLEGICRVSAYFFGRSRTLIHRLRSSDGIVYAPIPIPILDVYAKAGVARLQTSVDAAGAFGCWSPLQCAAYPVSVHRDQTDARFAYGAGIQAKLSAIGIRLEYERISVSGGDPDLLSLGVTWTF
jgi:hypothetical protein